MVVLMLDLSSAFDTVDHNRLLQILFHEIGIRGMAYQWFVSFLKGRMQRVLIEGATSSDIEIEFGVPQGSVLGPILFNIYIRSFTSVIKSSGFLVHGFADDHQVYRSYHVDFQYNCLEIEVNRCFSIIKQWMDMSCLKLNGDKTEIIVFSPPDKSHSLALQHVIVDSNCLVLSKEVKNLGFWLDRSLLFDTHVSKVISNGYHLLKNISKIRRFLSIPQLSVLCTSTILSRIDYCNSLFYGMSKSNISKLQGLQNAAARLIYGRRKRDGVSDLFKCLHWLPVEARIYFKVILLAFKCLHGLAPSYLSDLIILLDANNQRVHMPYFSTKFGDRSFSHAGPRLWNSLPLYLRKVDSLVAFKAQLKYYLFNNLDVFKSNITRLR